jgi:hypothetical protein
MIGAVFCFKGRIGAQRPQAGGDPLAWRPHPSADV